jgi:hypothetical protein
MRLRNVVLLMLICLIPTKISLLKQPITKVAPIKALKDRGDMHDFLKSMARMESDNDPRAVNRFGMLGKYQFHPQTIREVGIVTTKEEFLNDEALQDTAMIRYLRANNTELQWVIKKFSGKMFLASAHLTGTMGVLSYFFPEKYQYRTSDANGASVQLYMKKFANFNLDL